MGQQFCIGVGTSTSQFQFDIHNMRVTLILFICWTFSLIASQVTGKEILNNEFEIEKEQLNDQSSDAFRSFTKPRDASYAWQQHFRERHAPARVGIHQAQDNSMTTKVPAAKKKPKKTYFRGSSQKTRVRIHQTQEKSMTTKVLVVKKKPKKTYFRRNFRRSNNMLEPIKKKHVGGSYNIMKSRLVRNKKILRSLTSLTD